MISSTFPLTLGSTFFYSPSNTPPTWWAISISNRKMKIDFAIFVQTVWINLAEEDKTEKQST